MNSEQNKPIKLPVAESEVISPNVKQDEMTILHGELNRDARRLGVELGGAEWPHLLLYREIRKAALNEADALRSVLIAMRDAIATCDPDQFGIGGGKHEGDTAWYIRDELIARANAALKPKDAETSGEGTE